MALKKKVNFLKIKEIILSELKKIKSHPSQFVYQFILEKSFRGIDGYAANSKIPGVKIAKIKMKNDPRNVPLGGARVKYAIASTVAPGKTMGNINRRLQYTTTTLSNDNGQRAIGHQCVLGGCIWTRNHQLTITECASKLVDQQGHQRQTQHGDSRASEN